MDPKTIFIMSSLVHVIVAGALFLTWRMNRTIAGTVDWAMASLLIAIGTWLIILIRTDLGLYAGIASKLAIIYGLYRLWRGTRRFFNRPIPSSRAVVAIGILTLGTLIYASTATEAPFAARLLISAPLASLFFFFLSAEFLRRDKDGNRPPMALATASITFIYGGLTLYRFVITVVDYPVHAPTRNIDLLQFISSPLLTTFVAFVLILLTTDRLHQNLRRQAAIDPLTDIFNRRAFHDLQRGYLAHARRDKAPVALSMVDLDHFKAINDTYGHDVGDAVLVQTVDRIRASLRSEDIVARFGGEEFVILHPQTTIDAAAQIADRVRLAIESEPFVHNGTSVAVTASIGITGAIAPDNIDALTKAADNALYAAKHAGRNRIATQVPEGMIVPA